MSALDEPRSALQRTADWSLPLLAAAHVPLVLDYYWNLWKREHYQFYPFALAACAALAYQRVDRAQGWHWSRLSLALAALDALLLLAASLVNSPWAATIAACLLTWATLASLRDRVTGRSLAYLAALPVLTISLPVGYDLRVIQWLQTATTRVASRLLLDLGYLHVRQGNVLQFPSKSFLVEEACSGVQSLFTLLFLAALLCCWKRRGWPHLAALLAAAFGLAGIMNVLRVLAIAVVWENSQIDLSTGWPHELLGHAALLAATGLLWSADAFLYLLDAPLPTGGRTPPYLAAKIGLWNRLFAAAPRAAGESARQPAVTRRTAWLGVAVPAFALCCLVTQVAAMRPTPKTFAQGKGLDQFPDAVLPAELADFAKQGYEQVTRDADNAMGNFSNIWKYANPRIASLVSCDHAFFGWHDLTVCYTNNGWIVERQRRVVHDNWEAVLADMFHPAEMRHALLAFSAFDEQGRPVDPPPEDPLGNKLSGLFGAWRKAEAQANRVAYQSQTLTESLVPLTAEARQAALELHVQAREKMRATLRPQAP